MVEYFQVDGVSGDYFSCQKYGVMSVKACARNYGDAPKAHDSGRLGACLGCPIGRGHVEGTSASCVPELAANVGGTIANRAFCVRCRRASSDTGQKLIGRMRLLRNKTICISCYNREREIRIGKNAKGAAPKKWASMLLLKLAVVHSGGIEIEELDHPVFDRLEGIYTVMRRSKGEPVAVGWTPSLPTIAGSNHEI